MNLLSRPRTTPASSDRKFLRQEDLSTCEHATSVSDKLLSSQFLENVSYQVINPSSLTTPKSNVDNNSS